MQFEMNLWAEQSNIPCEPPSLTESAWLQVSNSLFSFIFIQLQNTEIQKEPPSLAESGCVQISYSLFLLFHFHPASPKRN